MAVLLSIFISLIMNIGGLLATTTSGWPSAASIIILSAAAGQHLSKASYLKNSYGRGGGGSSLPPECGVRFGHGMLGRGHSSLDFDSNSEYGEYPWHVAILSNIGGVGRYICGGAIVDCNHIVTAAHCVKSLYPDEISVRVGDWDASSNSELYEHKTHRVSDIFIHERFYAGSLHNDIALLRLENKIHWDEVPHVAPICLPRPQEIPHPGTKCWVTGWGKDAFLRQGDYQAILQEVDVHVVDSNQCEYSLRHAGLGKRFRMHHGWLCAGGEAGKDACSGDGGGPLVCGVDSGDGATLAGLVSWGVGCGEAGVPGVYTNIANYVNWIYETIDIV